MFKFEDVENIEKNHVKIEIFFIFSKAFLAVLSFQGNKRKNAIKKPPPINQNGNVRGKTNSQALNWKKKIPKKATQSKPIPQPL